MTPLVTVDDLVVSYPGRRRQRSAHPAVDGLSFRIDESESVGLVGESGSGKTTIGRVLLGLVPAQSGKIVFAGTDVTSQRAGERGALLSHMQVVFQDPYSSLNPVRTVGQSLQEALDQLQPAERDAAHRRVAGTLARVGLPTDTVDRYPSQFSGGQRQRIAIARALVVEPRLIICDEPVSALDVSTQAQVLNLFDELRQESGHSYLFIGHNLAVVRRVSQRLIVLFRGQVMETGPSEQVMDAPVHPYTQALVAAVPVADVPRQRARRKARRALVRVPDPAIAMDAAAPTNLCCPFAHRCPFTAPVCLDRRPHMTRVGASLVACHRHDPTTGHPSPVSVGAN